VGVRRGTDQGRAARSWFQHAGSSRYRLIQFVSFPVSAVMKRQAGRNGRAAQMSPCAFCPFQNHLFTRNQDDSNLRLTPKYKTPAKKKYFTINTFAAGYFNTQAH
jgi:hypothetical protein